MSPVNPKPKTAPKKRDPYQVDICTRSGEDEAAATARVFISPTLRGGVATQSFCKAYGESELQSLINELDKQCEQVHGGDLKRTESMLVTQAHTLDAIFNELARRAALNVGEYLNAADRYMRLALKAQSQCRATLETLATIKNPPVIYAKQANIANGPQQVNNGLPSSSAYGGFANEPNKLLEQRHEQRLDTATSSEAICLDSTMATMGEGYRVEDGSGQGSGINQRR